MASYFTCTAVQNSENDGPVFNTIEIAIAHLRIVPAVCLNMYDF